MKNKNEIILKDKVFSLMINDDQWNVYLCDEDDDTFPLESFAETDFYKKELYFRDVTMRLVTHEIFHVFVYYTYSDTANLSPLQMEEVACEILAWEWDKLAKLREVVYNGLKKLEKE